MSKIRENRAARWRRFDAMTPRERRKNGIAAVHSSCRTMVGYSERMVSPYEGEAGRSSRMQVLWEDGSMTLCAVKGMMGWGVESDALPGGFSEWCIQ